ncbi:MAG: VCBS repeat-containing protein [Bryobacteraceae bacterium]|nr:VCBS repeat-containing protein [Bryobacteraceae bacterium]
MPLYNVPSSNTVGLGTETMTGGFCSRAICLFLFVGALPCAAQFGKKSPCKLDYEGWTTVVGFTYNKVKVRKAKDQKKAGSVFAEVTSDGATSTVELKESEWTAAITGCDWGLVPQGVKDKLGIPDATAVRGEATMASLDFDTGDLDGDGREDHVKVSARTGSLIVELMMSDGRLGPRVNYSAGANPQAVLLADFNNDGPLDAVVANGGAFGQNNGSVSVLIGNGDGTFRAAVEYAQGGSASSLAVADFNGDGRADVAATKEAANGGAGSVAVLLGRGDGTFSAPATYPVEAGPRSIVAADFTGNRRLDLAVANRDGNSVSLLPGDGNGGFGAAVRTAVGPQPEYLAAIDSDIDGRWDLVILHQTSGTLSAWLGQADGRFRATGRYLTGVDIGSFVIVQHEDDPPVLLAPDAAGKRMLIHAVNLDGTLTGAPAYTVGPSPGAFAAGDFNGDNRPDIAVTETGPRLSLLLSRAGGGFEEARTVAIESAAGAIAAGDFNGDTRADLAVASANRIAILLGGGNGSFQPGTGLAGVASPAALCVLDANNDGRPDLALVNFQREGSVSVYIGNGDGTFRATASYPTGFFPQSATAGDFNRDGRSDLVVVNAGNGNPASVSVLIANADGSMQPAVNIPAGTDAAGAAVADFNGDGDLDVVFSGLLETSPNFLFHVSVAPGNGNGTFQPLVTTRAGDLPGAVAAGDFDGDGKQDLVVARCCGATDLETLAGNGDGTFRRASFPGGTNPIALATADFDRDGQPDVAVLNQPRGGINGVVWILESGPAPLRNTSAATNTVRTLAPDSIVAAYGAGLADATAVAPTADWPQTLGGTTVTVRDERGATRPCRIYYVSPGQVNYHLPAETAPGFAVVTITSGSGRATRGLIRVVPTSPAFFLANRNGAAAGFVVRARPNGEQVMEQTVVLNNLGDVVARQITLGPDNEQEVLLLFGTSIRGRASLSDVTATIGGVPATVLYAGPQNEYPGLDQVNILIPKALRGRGLVNVVLSAGGSEANTVNIRVF